MSAKVAEGVVKQVKPILSLNREDARRRAINLYKAWYRLAAETAVYYDIPKSLVQCRQRLREEFDKHKNISDVRVIDMLIIKGQMELQEVARRFQSKHHIMAYWKESVEPKPKDFLSKFLSGKE